MYQNNSVLCRCPFQAWMEFLSNAVSEPQAAVKTLRQSLYLLSYKFRKRKKNKIVVVRQEVGVGRNEIIVVLIAF